VNGKKKPAKVKPNPVSDDDMALFRDAVGEVRTVNHDRVETNQPKPKPVVRHSEQDDRSVMQALLEELSESDFLETGEHLSYTQPGVQHSVLKKLKSGKYSIQSEIDLHGLTVEEARSELSDFLKEAQQRRHLCIRVIHGKGRKNIERAPRLKPAVNQWLQRNSRVLAFCSARNNDGGTGAVYVLLKKPAT
jgi:DNA-nicking Smr family endonuclease